MSTKDEIDPLGDLEDENFIEPNDIDIEADFKALDEENAIAAAKLAERTSARRQFAEQLEGVLMSAEKIGDPFVVGLIQSICTRLRQ